MDSPTPQPKPTRKELAERRKLFVDFYLGDARGNGTKAAKMAGYEFPAEEAYRLLRNAQVRARIDERLATVAMSANEILAELSDIGRSGWKDFVEVLEWGADGKPLRVRMDLGSKVKSLELLGKYHALFTENIQVGGGIKIEITGVDTDAL